MNEKGWRCFLNDINCIIVLQCVCMLQHLGPWPHAKSFLSPAGWRLTKRDSTSWALPNQINFGHIRDSASWALPNHINFGHITNAAKYIEVVF